MVVRYTGVLRDPDGMIFNTVKKTLLFLLLYRGQCTGEKWADLRGLFCDRKEVEWCWVVSMFPLCSTSTLVTFFFLNL